MNKEIGTIVFSTLSAMAIWRAEILGQLSDGMWENTMPMDHWKFWHHLGSKYEPNVSKVVMNDGCYVPFRQKVGYNIAGLYEYVGDRMVNHGRMGRALQSLGATDFTRDQIEAGDELAQMTFEEFKQRKAANDWGVEYLSRRMNAITDEQAEAFYATKYVMKDLRKDVGIIKEVMKTVGRL